jgi:hypothetical protein
MIPFKEHISKQKGNLSLPPKIQIIYNYGK